MPEPSTTSPTDAGRGTSLGFASLLGVLLMFSFGPTVSSRITVNPLVSTFIRLWSAAAVHWIAVTVLGRRPTLAMLRTAGLAGVLFALNNIVTFAAFQRASVANVTLLIALQPVIVILMSKPMFGERVTSWDAAWTAVALGGTFFAVLSSRAGSTSTRPTTALGLAFAVASTLIYTGYFLIAKQANSRPGEAPPHPVTYMTAVTTAAAITSVPCLLLGGQAGSFGQVSASQFGTIQLMVVITAIAHVLLAFTHRHVEALVSSLVLLSQPVTSALVAWWLLDQGIVIGQVLGGLVVIGAVAMVMFRRRSISRSSARPSAAAHPVADGAVADRAAG